MGKTFEINIEKDISIHYTNKELRRIWDESRKNRRQIKIMEELTGLSEEVILNFLHENGRALQYNI